MFSKVHAPWVSARIYTGGSCRERTITVRTIRVAESKQRETDSMAGGRKKAGPRVVLNPRGVFSVRNAKRKRPQKASGGHRRRTKRLNHELFSLDKRPDGRWIARCKCGWNKETPTRFEAQKAFQSHQYAVGGVRLNPRDPPKGISEAQAKMDARLRRRSDARLRSLFKE